MGVDGPEVTQTLVGGGPMPAAGHEAQGDIEVVAGLLPGASVHVLVSNDGMVELLEAALDPAHTGGRPVDVLQLPDGSLLVTNWATSSLFQWSERTGVLHLARDFKGPADFCAFPGKGGEMTVVVPDLVTGVLRFVSLK